MTVDCEGWTKEGRKLPGLILPDCLDSDAALRDYRKAEPDAYVIRLTVSDMRPIPPLVRSTTLTVV